MKESQKWIHVNKGLKVQLGAAYSSPRISSEVPDCSMPLTFDHYNFCSLGCVYCFSYFFKSNNPAYKGADLHLKGVNIDAMIAAMHGAGKNRRDKLLYKYFYSQEFLLHWGGLADPFCNFETRNRYGFKLIDALGEMNYPTLFSFKGCEVLSKDYQKLFARYSAQSNFAFQISMVTNSDELCSHVEIGVPTTTERLEAMKVLSDMGYWTILRLRPFIMGISDIGLDELLDRAKDAGVNGVSVEWFALDARSNEGMKKRYNWLGKIMGVSDLHKYYVALSPKERGGYMRLNRKVKEPFMKQIYAFCIKNDLVCGVSDPDFKELNTSGSCCGMPDSYPKNRKLENWTKNQLTYYLKCARQKYHKTGESVCLHFEDVYGEEKGEKSAFLDEAYLADDHIQTMVQSSAARSQLTLRRILRRAWNNLRSPANPSNYFHGKILPIGVDGAGDLIYKYMPMDYEERWVADGIDLCA